MVTILNLCKSCSQARNTFPAITHIHYWLFFVNFFSLFFLLNMFIFFASLNRGIDRAQTLTSSSEKNVLELCLASEYHYPTLSVTKDLDHIHKEWYAFCPVFAAAWAVVCSWFLLYKCAECCRNRALCCENFAGFFKELAAVFWSIYKFG